MNHGNSAAVSRPWPVHVINPDHGCHDIRLEDLDGDGKVDVICSGSISLRAPEFVAFQNDPTHWQVVYEVANVGDAIAVLRVGSGTLPHLVGAAPDGNFFWFEHPRLRGGNARTPHWVKHFIGPGNVGNSFAAGMLFREVRRRHCRQRARDALFLDLAEFLCDLIGFHPCCIQAAAEMGVPPFECNRIVLIDHNVLSVSCEPDEEFPGQGHGNRGLGWQHTRICNILCICTVSTAAIATCSCKFRVVWCPKYRRSVLVDGADERLKQIIARVCGAPRAIVKQSIENQKHF